MARKRSASSTVLNWVEKKVTAPVSPGAGSASSVSAAGGSVSSTGGSVSSTGGSVGSAGGSVTSAAGSVGAAGASVGAAVWQAARSMAATRRAVKSVYSLFICLLPRNQMNQVGMVFRLSVFRFHGWKLKRLHLLSSRTSPWLNHTSDVWRSMHNQQA